MDDAQHRVAVLHGVHQHADGDQIEDLLERLVLKHHLAVDAVEVLGPAVDLVVDVHLLDLVAERADDGADVRLALGALHADLDDQVLIALWIEVAQAQVLELLLDLVDAQAVCDGRVDVQRLLCDALLTLRRLRLERTHIVQPVRQLDEHHADVLAHGEDHLADGLRLLLHAGGKVKALELGDAVHQQRDLLAELLLDDLERHVLAVLHGVVKQARSDGRRVEHQVRQDAGDRAGMDEIRLTGLSLLSRMRLLGEMIGLFDQLHVGLWVVFDQYPDQLIQIFATLWRHSRIPPCLTCRCGWPSAVRGADCSPAIPCRWAPSGRKAVPPASG